MGCYSKTVKNDSTSQAIPKDTIRHPSDSIARIIFPKIETDLEQLGLKGKVKIYREQFFDAHDSAGKIIFDSSFKFNQIWIYCFDSAGNRVELKTILRDGKIGQHYRYEFSKGEKKQYRMDERGWVLDERTLYDSARHVIEEDSYDYDGNIDRTVYRLDSTGREIRSRTQLEDSLENYTTTTYYKNGNFVTRQYKPDESLDKSTVYSYDDKGNELAELETDSAGGFNAKVIYAYDELGNMIQEIHYGAMDTIFSKTFYTYDAHGNKTQEEQYLMPKDTLAFKYNWINEYDKNENIIRQIHQRNNRVIGVEFRKIEYYP